MKVEEGLWVSMCFDNLSSVLSPSPVQGLKPIHPPAGQISLLWTTFGSLNYHWANYKKMKVWSDVEMVEKEWVLTTREVRMPVEQGRGGGVGWYVKCKERGRRNLLDVWRGEKWRTESPCRVQSSLFSFTKNSSSSANPVLQDTTIWIEASITSHNA